MPIAPSKWYSMCAFSHVQRGNQVVAHFTGKAMMREVFGGVKRGVLRCFSLFTWLAHMAYHVHVFAAAIRATGTSVLRMQLAMDVQLVFVRARRCLPCAVLSVFWASFEISECAVCT